MRRRDFISGIAGSAAALIPFGARAQAEVRRVGVLMSIPDDDPDSQARIAAFRLKLHELGWVEGRNLQVDTRAGGSDLNRIRAYAAELAALRPDVIFAAGAFALAALHRAVRTIPVVFAQAPDPVALGYVASVRRPGGNITGFALFDEAFGAKWLELVKQIAPHVVRVAFLRDPNQVTSGGYLTAIEAAAPSLRVQVLSYPVFNSVDIERAIASFASEPNGALIVPPAALTVANRDLIASLALRHTLPSVFAFRSYVISGGLACYGVALIDQYRSAASYVDRILKGEEPGDLPIQFATKFELVINLKTAKALGLDVPPMLLARADEVIE